MKKLVNILMALATMGFVAISCQQKEEEYTAGDPDVTDCYGVYFPTQDASGSHIYNPIEDPSLEITVARTNTNGAITVPVTVTYSEDGIFTKDDITFADGQSETTFTLRFDNAVQGTNYSAHFVVEDKQYASNYNEGAIGLDLSVMVVAYEYFLNPVTGQPAKVTFTQTRWGEVHTAYIKYYEVDGIRYCTTYGEETAASPDDEPDWSYEGGFWGLDPDQHLEFLWYRTGTQNCPDCGESHPHTIPAGYDPIPEDAELMTFPHLQTYYVHSSAGQLYMVDYYWYQILGGYSRSYLHFIDANSLFDNACYYDGNGGFYFWVLGYCNSDRSGWWPQDFDVIGIAEGFVRTDFSFELGTDYTVEGVTPIYVEAGADVATMEYAIYEGELTATQVANKVEAISEGTESTTTFSDFEYDEDENVKYATLGVSPETTGTYTLVAVVKDSKGEIQNSASVVFKHISASDTEEYAVDVMVGTENVPARYVDYDNITAFGYYILGSDITDVHAAIVTTKSYESDPEGYAEAIKAGTQYALSEDELAQVNAEGGFFALATGLNPLTSYTVLVWATNGDLDTIVTAEHTTDGLPLELLATGTYTYAAWWEGYDDEQALYADPNYENTYVLTNWGGGVDFKFTMDKDGIIYIPTFYIGANHSSYGAVYYVDPYDWYSEASMEADPTKAEHSYYDAETDTYNFHFVLAVSAGSFGHFWESFTPAAESQSAVSPVMNLNSVSLKGKNPGKTFVSADRIHAERDPQPVKANVTVSYDRKEKVNHEAKPVKGMFSTIVR